MPARFELSLFVYFIDVGSRYLDESVEATIKYDGSLGIAFTWNGEVMVTTRRRMDSQQAIWAKQWIKDHCNLTKFQPGYTYLFEIIYQDNTVIVNYLFEGLVLLAITDESGHELSYQELLQCARTIGFFMVAPRITGSYSDVLWYCGGIESGEEPTASKGPPFTSGALPVNERRQEGWVLKFNDGSRKKVVYKWWKDASKLAQLVHPQVVWLLLKHDKLEDVFGNAPYHFQVEIRRMVQVIGRKFEETVRLFERFVKLAFVQCSSNFDDLWTFFDDNGITCYVKEYEGITPVSGSETDRRLRQLFNQLKPHIGTRFWPLLVSDGGDDDRYRSPFYNYTNANVFRIPVLNYICPTSPALDGYEPSDNFKQTWCKGWTKQIAMVDQWQFLQTVLQRNNDVPPLLQLPAEIIVMILQFLDYKTLVSVAKVCVYLRKVAKSCKTLFASKKPFALKEQRMLWTTSYARPWWTNNTFRRVSRCGSDSDLSGYSSSSDTYIRRD